MSMVTRCPHCATSFRITSNLLKMHQGLVRCGNCSEVFNAFDSLSTVHDTPSHADISRQDAPVASLAAEPSQIEPDVNPVEAPSDVEPDVNPEEAPHLAELPDEMPEEETRQAELVQALPAEVQQVHEAEIGPGALDEIPASPVPEQEIVEEFFVGKKPSKFGWVWTAGSILLVLVLLAQAVYYFRMEISIETPGLKPFLQAYCRLLECTVPLPERVDLIGIESSSLQAEPNRVGVIDLNASIRNSAPFEQAYPLLELTLTDAQDAPLARKVFKPSDYLRKDIRIDAGIASNGAASVRLNLDTGTLLPNGYRLYLFYP